MVAFTFEVVSVRTNTLRESMFLVLKTFLELLFWNALQDGHRMSLNVGPSKRSSVLGKAKSRTGPNLANIVDGPISISIFCQTLPVSERVMSRGIVMMQDPSIRPKFRSPMNSKQPYVTLPTFPNNNVGSLFDLSVNFPPGRKHTLV
jgi:hypothetical protein